MLITVGRYIGNDILVRCKFIERAMATWLPTMSEAYKKERAETIIIYLKYLYHGKGIVQLTIVND